jgi:hypothetical protein
MLEINITYPKIASKKAMKSLSDRLLQPNLINKISPKRINSMTEEEVAMELTEGLMVVCHKAGCFHFTCENFTEPKIKLIGKTLPHLAEIYDIGKESENVEVVLYAVEEEIPRRRIAEMINKGVKPDFKAQVKNFYERDVKVGGIRFICPPDISCILDVSGISIRMGPRKLTLENLKDEKKVVEIIEENIKKIKKLLGV